MFSIGDVVSFYSEKAKKRKYHLCISVGGYFLFINSPKPYRDLLTDFKVDASDLPFLEPRPEGYSIISCSVVVVMDRAELLKSKAARLGAMPKSVMQSLFEFIETSKAIDPEVKETILDHLADWL